jgi:small subunit ribosomal protein S6
MNKHYEIVLLIHPDRSDQVNAMVQRYQDAVVAASGKVHRYEDWGRLQLAYPIKKVRKAHYILMNIESSVEMLNELKSMFKYNDAIIRSLVLLKDSAETGPSPMVAGAASTDSRPTKRHERTERR